MREQKYYLLLTSFSQVTALIVFFKKNASIYSSRNKAITFMIK